MAIMSPLMQGGHTPDQLSGYQADQQKRGLVTPDAAAINTPLQQLPAYQAYVSVLQRPHSIDELHKAQSALDSQAKQAGLTAGDNLIFDPNTAQYREKNWDERHGVLSALKYIGMTSGAGLGAGAALGAAGLTAGAAGAGAAGGGAGGAAGFIGPVESGAAGIGAGMVGPVEAGAAGLGAAGATGTASGLGAGLGEAGATTGLASGAGLPGAAAAPTVGDLVTDGSAIAGGGGAGGVGSLLSNGSTLSKIAQLAGLGGTAISDATKSAGDTQLQKALIGLTANNQNQQAIANANNTNITGNNAYENQLLARTKDEEAQRANALKDVYRSSYVANPRVSQYDIGGAPQYSDQYRQTVSGLGNQGAGTLGNAAQYATANQPALKPYTPYTPIPYDPNTMSGPGGTQQSTMQEIGNWLGPTLSTIGAISKIWGR